MGYATSWPGPWNVVCPPRRASMKDARPSALRCSCCEGETVPISRRPQVYTGVNWAVMMCGGGAGRLEGGLEARKRATRVSWRRAAVE